MTIPPSLSYVREIFYKMLTMYTIRRKIYFLIQYRKQNSIGLSVILPVYQQLTLPSFPNVLLIGKFYQLLSNFENKLPLTISLLSILQSTYYQVLKSTLYLNFINVVSENNRCCFINLLKTHNDTKIFILEIFIFLKASVIVKHFSISYLKNIKDCQLINKFFCWT